MRDAPISGKFFLSKESVYIREARVMKAHTLVHGAFVQPPHSSGWYQPDSVDVHVDHWRGDKFFTQRGTVAAMLKSV